MRIVVAPDSFKGSLSALEVCQAIEAGLREALGESVEIVSVPLADGGEGTVQALADATRGRIVPKRVTGPLGEPVDAFYGLLGDGRTAAIEMAAASGLPLIASERRDPCARRPTARANDRRRPGARRVGAHRRCRRVGDQ